MIRTPPLALVALLLSLPAWAQQTDWLDDFSASQLDARWTRDVSRHGTLALDPARQVVVLGGKENVHNHLETDLPADVTTVQADLNSVTDTAASWAPSLILYWGPQAYVRVMLSMHYGFRLELAPRAATLPPVLRTRPIPDTWYRLKVLLGADTVTCVIEQPGTTVAETVQLPRAAEWRGPCRLVVGKGYMQPQGGNPDFDNDYARPGKNVSVLLDNVAVGQPTDLAGRLAASVAAARVAGEHDPQSLRVAFWPNVLSDQTRGTLWFAEKAYQRVCLIYANRDATHSAKQVRLEVEVSEHLAPEDLVAGGIPLQVQTERTDGLVRFAADFPAHFVLPAGFQGVNQRDGDQFGWFSWPISRMMPPVFLHCRPQRQDVGKLRARLLREGQPGPWAEVAAQVLPPLPPLPPADRSHLGLSLWEGGALAPEGSQGQKLLTNMLKQYQQVGLTRLHVHSHAPVFRTARQLGIHANLMSWWDYSAQCPPEWIPTPEERATDPDLRYTTFCPEIIGTGAGTYGKFLDALSRKMKEFDADGFMLDYECRPPLCYCDRCREAFRRYTGLADAKWPEDVKQGARHYERWIEFRCDQGARYVKVIGEAARRAKPGCPVQAWIAGYDYGGSIESAQIDISKAAAYLTEPEVPHYTLPDTYADMWIKGGELGSVEAGLKAVQDSLNVTRKPIAFCSSVIYPLGAATPWSDPQILNAQMLAMIGQGVRGISFWGGHDDGAVDGRYLHMLARWNAVLAAAGPFLREGKSDDAAVSVETPDKHRVRAYVWLLNNRTLVFIVNLTEQAQTARVKAGGTARQLLDGRRVDLSQPLTVPALEGVMVVVER